MSNSESFVPAVGATVSQVTGKPMNCDSWGTYEAPGSSPTSGYCNGGTVDTEIWAECPSKDACRTERNRRMFSASASGKVHLPQQPQSSVRVVGGQGFGAPRPSGFTGSPGTTIPTRPTAPTVINPETTNPHLATSRVLSSNRAGMHSPTFLPRPGEHWAVRFLKNVFQGAFNAFGHHVFEFTQSVDLFPFHETKKDKEKPPE